MMIVESKTAQPIEPDEELINLQLNQSRNQSTLGSNGRGMQKPSLYSKTFVQPVEVWSRDGQDPMVTCQVLNANSCPMVTY